MTAINRAKDFISIMKEFDKRLSSLERGTAFDDESDLPPAPPVVALAMKIREHKTHVEFSAMVTWASTSANTCQADVDYWVVEIQPTNAAGVPKDHVTQSPGSESVDFHANINNKAQDQPHALFGPLPHPREWYYRARVRIVDKAHRKGPFSEWTTPQLAIETADPQPPVPKGLTINYNTIDGSRWDRQQAEVEWDEINEWDIPGERLSIITNATATGNVATFTTSAPHFIQVDDKVIVKGVGPQDYNGTWRVQTVPTNTTFKANIGANPNNLTNQGNVTDTVDHENDVASYMVQFRRCDASGNAIGGVRKRNVTAKDNDTDDRVGVTFEKGLHKSYYYQARVRSIDRFSRRGDFSAWTTPATPGDAVPPPVPIKVRAFSTIHQFGIDWEPPMDPDDPELPHPDIAYFQVQVSMSANFRTIARRDVFVNSTVKTFASKRYRTAYWLRVRSVDAAGNKSAWIAKGPVKPLKAGVQRRAVTGFDDVDWTNDDGLVTFTSTPNKAYLNSVSANGSASAAAGANELGVPNSNGVVSATIKLSDTTNRARMGLLFRGNGATDYLYADLDKTASQGVVRLRKCDSGAHSSLTTANVTLVNGNQYDLQVIMEDDKISVYVSQALIINQFTLSAGDYTKFGGFSRYGMYSERSGSLDDGGSRLCDFMYTNTDGVDILLDFFDRDPNATTLGTLDTGQAWVAHSGTWGVSEHRVSGSIVGMSVQSPILTLYDQANYTDFQPIATNDPNLYTAATFEIDRPIKMTIMAYAIVQNPSPVDYRLFFYIVTEMSGQVRNGTGAFRYTVANDRPDQLVNMRSIYMDPGATPKPVTLSWGFRQNDASSREATISDMRMIVIMSYAPDIPATSDIVWTKDEALKAYYRSSDPDE